MSLSFYSQDGVYRGYYKEVPITKNNLTSHLANCTYLGVPAKIKQDQMNRRWDKKVISYTT